MSTHRFILEPYKGIATRHTCPECHKKRSFARYIDTEGKIEFAPYVGRCNHEQSCGYHFTPKDFFEKNPEKNETFTKDDTISYKKREMPKPLPTSYIDENIMRSSQKFISIYLRAIVQISLFSSPKICTSIIEGIDNIRITLRQ